VKEHTVEAIAKALGVSRKTVYRHLAPAGWSTLVSQRSSVWFTARYVVRSAGPQQALGGTSKGGWWPTRRWVRMVC